jgi:hypothetical protein
MLPNKLFFGENENDENEGDKRVFKHNKLNENKDDVEMKKNEGMFGNKSILDEEKWMKVKMRRTTCPG